MVTTATYQIITPDGVTFNLDAMPGGCGYIIHGLENIGMPPVRAYTHYVPGQSGAVLDDLLDDVRVITISHAATGADIDNVFEEMNDVLANYRYNRTLTLQPLRLRVTFGSKSADLYCYYNGMTTGKLDNRHALFGINLVAYDPYWYSTTETSTTLDPTDTLAVSYIMGRVNGLWTAMGNSGTASGVKCMAVDNAGDLYVGGSFATWGGVAGADCIAKYDVSAGTWSRVGGASDINSTVYAIAVAANGDVYIGGEFLDAGGDANADRIAVLRNGAANFTNIGVANGIVLSLCLTSNGVLWAGGNFDSIGGTAAEAVAYMSVATPGTWSAAAGLDNAVDFVRSIVEGQDGTIYIGGTITNASGDTDADGIAYWTGAAWAAVGGPMDSTCYSLRIAPDGQLYAAGAFTTWDGVTVNRIGRWDGSVVSAMDSGLDDTAREVWISDDNRVYVSGSFNSAGGVAVYDGVAIWDGNAWRLMPVTFPGAAIVYAIATIGDDLFFGFNTTGNASVPGDATVTYSGNVAFPPTITITAAATARTLYSIRNETTGVEILANLYVSPGETITIDLGSPGEIPAGKSVTSSWATRPGGGNLLGKILSPTALTRFALVPAPIAAAGANLINCRMTGTGPTVTMKHYNRYDSLQAALD